MNLGFLEERKVERMYTAADAFIGGQQHGN